MSNRQDMTQQRVRLRYQSGDQVRIVKGADVGHAGVIVDVYPTHERPYLVQLNEAWYTHYPEDRLEQDAPGV